MPAHQVASWVGALSLVIAGIVGCGGDAAMDNAGADAAVPVDAGSSVVVGAKFSEIYPLIFPNNTVARCNFCHSMPPSETSNGKLGVGPDASTAHAALVGKNSASGKCMNRPLVAPGQPEQSLLLQKLGPTPPCGSRMPIGGAPLSEAQLDMVRSWIAAGAKND